MPRVRGEIEPEADPATLKPDASFRDELDIDSMAFLNFAIGLREELGVEIHDSDYPKLAALRLRRVPCFEAGLDPR